MSSPRIVKTRIENRLPVAREGLPFIVSCLVLTALLFYGGLYFFATIMGILGFFIIYFFRDPERISDAPDNAILTPADGRVLNIRDIKDSDNPLREPAIKVSVFMSVFNVHINRAPMSGRISKIVYNPGRFFSANLDKASEQNENNKITLDTKKGGRVVFVQIAGLIARRIVCWINEHDYVKAGQRFGLIRFGSRLDIYLPAESRVIIQPKERVKAGETIIGFLP
jgi:phosphatidylserine decarboxylase